MRRDNERLIYGYDKFKPTVGVSLDEFRRELSIKSRELAAPDFCSMIQVHGNQIAIASPGVIHLETDGLVSNQPGLMLFGCFADCLPIYVWDEKASIIGLAHAGWKGTAGRISQKLVEAMIELGAAQMKAWIGPGICAQHYEVSPGFDELVRPLNPAAMIETAASAFFDLAAENKTQLMTYLAPQAIELSGICTYASQEYYSYRRDQKIRGRNIGYLMLK